MSFTAYAAIRGTSPQRRIDPSSLFDFPSSVSWALDFLRDVATGLSLVTVDGERFTDSRNGCDDEK